MERAGHYVDALADNNRYVLCIWPPHCLIGSWGHCVTEPVYDALLEWEENFSLVDYTLKGLNMWTEHYSALKADVEDPDDPATALNEKLIKRLREADVVAISGQALSHCVANTVKDLADNSADEDIRKLVLLIDTTSSVKGFEKLGEDFVLEMTGRGMQVCTADEFGRDL
jgi:nicotinamidase-related amidase